MATAGMKPRSRSPRISSFVTGVLPYRDGLIVTLAGQITFFADRDGDGKAEHRETWFSGFAQENSQLQADHPTFGPDGFVYVANGLRGGKVSAVKPEWKKSDEPLTITGFDFRFHPETGEFSTVTGQGQFGMSSTITAVASFAPIATPACRFCSITPRWSGIRVTVRKRSHTMSAEPEKSHAVSSESGVDDIPRTVPTSSPLPAA